MSTWILLIQFVSTWAMVGLIWFVQIVHYPLMGQVGSSEFVRYELDHQRLTSYVVGPFMLAELFTAVWLVLNPPARLPVPALWAGLVLLGIIWVGTYTIQVPQHAQLAHEFSAAVQRQLVIGNWIRTVAWTLRGALVMWMISRLMPASMSVSV